MLLPQTDRETAVRVANRIAVEFREVAHTLISSHPVADKLTMSMGLACLRLSHPEQPHQLLNQADRASTRQGTGTQSSAVQHPQYDGAGRGGVKNF